MDWFRWWHGTVTDPKFQWISRKSGQPVATVVAVWACLLEHASSVTQCNAQVTRGSVSGFNCNDYDVLLGVDDEVVAGIYEAMVARGMIVDGSIAKWEERQPKREDSSAERVRRHREKKKQAALAGGVTQRNAPDTDTDTDTDKGNSSNVSVAADGSEPAALPPAPAAPVSGTRPGAIAVMLRNLEKQRGIVPRITSTDPRVVQWAQDGVTDQQIGEAYELAAADRDMGERPKQPINAGFLAVFLDKVLNPPTVTVTTGSGSKTRPARPAKPWFLTGSGIEKKAAELGYTPPEGVLMADWKYQVFKLAGITEKEYRQAEIDYR